MSLCEEMTNQPDRSQFSFLESGLKAIEKVFSTWEKNIASYRANVERRDAFKRLQLLDQRTLKDIGLTKGDIDWASKLPIEQNAALELQRVRNTRIANKI